MNKVLALDRGSWGWLLVAAPLLLPLPSSHVPSLLASAPVAVSVTARRRIAKVLGYGSFEGNPAVWDEGTLTGFVLWDKKEGWRTASVVELLNNARLMTKEEFDKAYPNLPPLPAA
jgi:hypothetical protein